MEKIKQLVNSYKEDIIKHTQEIIKIPSVKGKPRDGMPFGEGINQALEYALGLSEQLGFQVQNVDGYAGHADLGKGDQTLGILVHLDVVPEGSNWSYPPFGGEIHEEKIYGRGAVDDKGPTIAALFAMKALKESGASINKKIRVIFGTDEESGWEDLTYYFNKHSKPDFGFTPDAEFPVIYGEKGIQILSFTKKSLQQHNCGMNIKSIKGGNTPNMVPDYCEALVEMDDAFLSAIKTRLDNFRKKTGYNVYLKENNRQIIIKSEGISAHGSLPEKGQNAISQLMVFLGEFDCMCCDTMGFVGFYNSKIGMEYNGQSIGCGFEDEISGKLIFNVGTINISENQVDMKVNIRYPITMDGQEVVNTIQSQLQGTGIDLKVDIDKKPLHVDKDTELVTKLMGVYRDLTGDMDSQPITIGGGTYARALDTAVAFGPGFPGQEELAHQKNEYIGIDHLMRITEIYAKALYELTR